MDREIEQMFREVKTKMLDMQVKQDILLGDKIALVNAMNDLTGMFSYLSRIIEKEVNRV